MMKVVYVLTRYDGTSYVVAIYATYEGAQRAAETLRNAWRDRAGKKVIWTQSASHPLRWSASSGDIFEIAEYLVQP